MTIERKTNADTMQDRTARVPSSIDFIQLGARRRLLQGNLTHISWKWVFWIPIQKKIAISIVGKQALLSGKLWNFYEG